MMDPSDSVLPGDQSSAEQERWILIVDDDPAVLDSLSTVLRPRFRVLTARTGAEGLKALGQHLFDLVLLDNVLPDMSGLVVLGTITRYLPSLPVILITGYGSEEVSVEAFREGARDYVKKPIKIEELMARIEQVFHARRRSGDVAVPEGEAGIPSTGAGVAITADTNLRRALAFMEANLHLHLSLEKVAREAGMSKFHFCRHFKALLGLSFREYLARRRIQRASILLRDQKRSLTEIYLDVGFKDQSHFGRVFRRITGQPPSRYRLLHRKTPPQP